MYRRFLARSCFCVALTVVALWCACLNPAEARQPRAGWKAGVASVVITPERPMLLCGGVSPKPSTGEIHDLYAKALALEDSQSTRLVIVTMDVAMIPMVLREWMEKEVARRCQLPPQGLLLNASHTHSGPEMRVKRAELFYAHDKADFAVNRRLKTEHGYTMAPNPDGPVDHDVPVLQVRSPDGRLRVVLFGYACHAVAFTSHKFCGDYPGFAQRYVEQAHPGATALFMTGCAGDQRPYPSGSLSLAKKYGRALADAVQRAMCRQGHVVRGPLRVALEQVPLEFDKPPTRQQLLEQIKSGNRIRRRRAEILLKELDETGTLRKTYPYYVHVARFGDDLILAALAWEAVVDYSLRLKDELAGPKVWVAAYSNEIYNYLPSLRVLQEGGYEAGGSLLGYTRAPARFAPSVEALVVGKVHELASKLQKSSDHTDRRPDHDETNQYDRGLLRRSRGVAKRSGAAHSHRRAARQAVRGA